MDTELYPFGWNPGMDDSTAKSYLLEPLFTRMAEAVEPLWDGHLDREVELLGPSLQAALSNACPVAGVEAGAFCTLIASDRPEGDSKLASTISQSTVLSRQVVIHRLIKNFYLKSCFCHERITDSDFFFRDEELAETLPPFTEVFGNLSFLPFIVWAPPTHLGGDERRVPFVQLCQELEEVDFGLCRIDHEWTLGSMGILAVCSEGLASRRTFRNGSEYETAGWEIQRYFTNIRRFLVEAKRIGLVPERPPSRAETQALFAFARGWIREIAETKDYTNHLVRTLPRPIVLAIADRAAYSPSDLLRLGQVCRKFMCDLVHPDAKALWARVAQRCGQAVPKITWNPQGEVKISAHRTYDYDRIIGSGEQLQVAVLDEGQDCHLTLPDLGGHFFVDFTLFLQRHPDFDLGPAGELPNEMWVIDLGLVRKHVVCCSNDGRVRCWDYQPGEQDTPGKQRLLWEHRVLIPAGSEPLYRYAAGLRAFVVQGQNPKLVILGLGNREPELQGIVYWGAWDLNRGERQYEGFAAPDEELMYVSRAELTAVTERPLALPVRHEGRLYLLNLDSAKRKPWLVGGKEITDVVSFRFRRLVDRFEGFVRTESETLAVGLPAKPRPPAQKGRQKPLHVEALMSEGLPSQEGLMGGLWQEKRGDAERRVREIIEAAEREDVRALAYNYQLGEAFKFGKPLSEFVHTHPKLSAICWLAAGTLMRKYRRTVIGATVAMAGLTYWASPNRVAHTAGFRSWRRQELGKQLLEVAQHFLVSTYHSKRLGRCALSGRIPLWILESRDGSRSYDRHAVWDSVGNICPEYAGREVPDLGQLYVMIGKSLDNAYLMERTLHQLASTVGAHPLLEEGIRGYTELAESLLPVNDQRVRRAISEMAEVNVARLIQHLRHPSHPQYAHPVDVRADGSRYDRIPMARALRQG